MYIYFFSIYYLPSHAAMNGTKKKLVTSSYLNHFSKRKVLSLLHGFLTTVRDSLSTKTHKKTDLLPILWTYVSTEDD